MFDFKVQSFRGEYSVTFVTDLVGSLKSELKEGDFLIVDRNVRTRHERAFNAIEGIQTLEVDACESLKSYQGLEPVINQVISRGFRRGNRFVAIGGGVVQDLTAFIASVLYRGVEWCFYPTTLLAQGDSCIGSKTSINFGAYKNQLGGFCPPSKIMIYVPFLESLSEADFLSGIGEMCHYFLIAGKEEFEWFKGAVEAATSRDRDVLSEMIRRSLEIKRQMVEQDEFDQGERQIFNYGHSFGHAIESLTHYRIPHGIAVAFGMDMANVVSEHLGFLAPGTRDEIYPFLARIWRGAILEGVSPESLVEVLGKDKKNKGDQLGLILTRGYGKMFKQQTDRFTVEKILKHYLEQKRS